MNDQAPLNLPRVADRLRWLRDQRGATLANVAEVTGLNASYLSRLESGAREHPSKKSIAALAVFFHASQDWIFNGHGQPFANTLLGEAKNTLFAVMQATSGISADETREQQVTRNVEVRIAQLKFSPEKKRAQYLKEIWDELVAYSAECGRNFPKMQEALLRVGRESAASETGTSGTPT